MFTFEEEASKNNRTICSIELMRGDVFCDTGPFGVLKTSLSGPEVHRAAFKCIQEEEDEHI